MWHMFVNNTKTKKGSYWHFGKQQSKYLCNSGLGHIYRLQVIFILWYIFRQILRLPEPDLPDHAHQQSVNIVIQGGAHLHYKIIKIYLYICVNPLVIPQHICNLKTRLLTLPPPLLFASLSPSRSCFPPESLGCCVSTRLRMYIEFLFLGGTTGTQKVTLSVS